MKGRTFVDTNILVYAYDLEAEEKKHNIAKNVLTDLWETGTGILSTQVLKEFYVTLTRKIPSPIEKKLARRIIKTYSAWDIVVNDTDIIIHACQIEDDYGFSFWDSLIISAAFSKNAARIVTEDLQHNQNVEGILILNPFKMGTA